MITVAFDEAGNTGQHLTNREQPLFVLASVNFNNEDVKRLHLTVCESDNDEAHYVKLKKSKRGRKKIISLMGDPLISKNNVKVVVFHKRFMVMAKVIDLLVEPLAAQNGINLYSNGACQALSNLHFICMQCFCGEVQTNDFFVKFTRMVREQNTEAIDDFYNHIQAMSKTIELSHNDYSKQLTSLWSTKYAVNNALEDCDLAALDPAVPAYTDLVSDWGDQLNALFTTIHDKSKIIAQYREHLLGLSDQRMKSVIFRVGPKTRTYPLKAIDLILEDSKNCKAIQIADIVAGSISHSARASAGLIPMDDFAIKFEKLNIVELVVSSVWPSDEINRYETNGNEKNPADTMAEYIHKQENLDN